MCCVRRECKCYNIPLFAKMKNSHVRCESSPSKSVSLWPLHARLYVGACNKRSQSSARISFEYPVGGTAILDSSERVLLSYQRSRCTTPGATKYGSINRPSAAIHSISVKRSPLSPDRSPVRCWFRLMTF
jgi:hypothetical protein